ncbi:elongator complex protein 3 [Mesotoga sp.]|jgi:histone acetyltransferase (RNA polymerase elongator complex component)|uniref:Histone acetyltransferase n=1 Tax=Mesotoga infera TaxID=1236046 RepID=A0A101H231_9BACT|nr:MAG: Histone acetyltransferase [Mesotoga infera]KUK91155.1 MAG: Histone acetyltransferase [Mesotoga infera]HCO70408.1 radical SAM protein [Mesotoga infera]
MLDFTTWKVTQKARCLRFVEGSLINLASSVYNINMNIVPIFVPHEGCRTRCTFCNEYSTTGVRKLPDREEVLSTVKRYQGYFRNPEETELAFYGGTFTGTGRQQVYLDVAEELVQKGLVKGIRFSTSPEQISEEMIAMLRSTSISFVELGVQSFDDDLLRNCCRNHGSREVYEAANRLRSSGIDFGIHLMTGLPGDTEEKDIYSTEEAIRLGASSVRIHPLVVLKGSFLEDEYLHGRFVPQGLEGSIEIVWKMYLLLVLAGVKVNRMGICIYGKQIENVVAGPFHPAFGELVRDRLMLEVIRRYCKGRDRYALKLDRKYQRWFTGHKKSVLERASGEGISIDFGDDGEDIDIPLYMKLIGEGILGEAYAET